MYVCIRKKRNHAANLTRIRNSRRQSGVVVFVYFRDKRKAVCVVNVFYVFDTRHNYFRGIAPEVIVGYLRIIVDDNLAFFFRNLGFVCIQIFDFGVVENNLIIIAAVCKYRYDIAIGHRSAVRAV